MIRALIWPGAPIPPLVPKHFGELHPKKLASRVGKSKTLKYPIKDPILPDVGSPFYLGP